MYLTLNLEIIASTLSIGWDRSCDASSGICHHRCTPAVGKKLTGWLFQPLRPGSLEHTVTDRTDGPDAGFPSLSGRPRLAGILSFASFSPPGERGNCDSGSIFRVRRCNKKQSSQRGVDRRWHGRPRRACRVGDRLSALSRATPVSLFIPSPFAFSVYRHDSSGWHLYQQVCQLPSCFACNADFLFKTLRESFVKSVRECTFDALFIPYMITQFMFIIDSNLCRLICLMQK